MLDIFPSFCICKIHNQLFIFEFYIIIQVSIQYHTVCIFLTDNKLCIYKMAIQNFVLGISLFAKASNLLDTPLLRYIHKGPHTENVNSERTDGNVIERKEWHGQSFMLGIRYKL